MTPKRLAFVKHYVATGGQNGAESARQAGFSEARARIEAYELLRDPEVQAAIQAECQNSTKDLLPAINKNLQTILLDPANPKHAEMLKWFYGTIGISPISKSEHKETRELEITEDTLARAKRLAQTFGIDPRRLLGPPKEQPVVIDITPEEEQW